MWGRRLLVAVGLWVAWLPAETAAATPAVLAAAVLALVPWAWSRTPTAPRRSALVLAAVLGLLALSALSGWDRAAALHTAALAALTATVIFLASREAPSETMLRVFALGIAGLSLWALWQVLAGFDRGMAMAGELPGPVRDYALARFDSGRGFASLLLPGHLAVLLAAALAVLLPAARDLRPRAGLLPWLGVLLCAVGLYLSYSPLGLMLALLVCAVLFLSGRRRVVLALAAGLVMAAVAAFAMRPDLTRFEPLQLRSDNWRTAVWLWTTAPVTGVGFGSYGQSSQAVPFAVGNRPVHAHCLPLELLAELGAAGIALVALGCWSLVRLVRRCWPRRPGLAVAVAVVPLHNLADFSLYTSGVAVPWALLVGWAWAATRGEDPVPEARPAGRTMAVAVAALALVAASCHSTSVAVGRAFGASDAAVDRFEAQLRAYQLAPWRPQPLRELAMAALDSGAAEHLIEASAVLEAAAWQQPRSPALALLASRLAWARGAAPTAVARCWEAARSRPHDTGVQGELDQLVDALDRGSAGGDG